MLPLHPFPVESFLTDVYHSVPVVHPPDGPPAYFGSQGGLECGQDCNRRLKTVAL